MAQTKHDIRCLLAEAGIVPRRRLGQHFMIDQNLLRLVVEAGEVTDGDWVLEVGPGTGALTEQLLQVAGRVVAVELDRNLASFLRGRLSGNARFSLIQGDALCGKHKLNAQVLKAMESAAQQGLTRKLVANLPYNIACPLIIDLLMAGMDVLAFSVQKEVAQRLVAGAGHKSYGPLSVMAQLLSKPEILRTMPPEAFWPRPKVESALVVMHRENQLGERAGEFSRFLQRLFSVRRKTLRNALARVHDDGESVLRACGMNGKIRAEELTPAQLLELFETVRGQNPEAT